LSGRKDLELMSNTEWGEELVEMNARLDELAIEMQQDKRSRWVHEWPIRKPKVKWPVKELMVMRQCRLLKGWLRYAESLNGREENEVQICELETGINISDDEEWGSAEDLKNCQEGREEIPVF
jgi:hypothetical protein